MNFGTGLLSACSAEKTAQTNSEAVPSEPPAKSSTISTEETESKPENEDASISDSGESNILVVYFSMPETTDPNNMTAAENDSTVVIDGEVLGNTQYVARLIEENTGADVFQIQPETPYPTDHDTLVDLAAEEQNANSRPSLAGKIESIEQYDVIFLGYPNWWGDMPMILYSFLEKYDLSGKTIIPFNTHGGSGLSDTVQTITKLQPNATVVSDAFTVSRNEVDNCKEDVIAWLASLNLTNN